MKKLAGMALFFSICFVIIFLAAAGMRYLSLRVEWAGNLMQKNETYTEIINDSALWALPLAMYTSVLLALNYSARKKYSTVLTIIIVMILSVGFNTGFSLLLNNRDLMPPLNTKILSYGEKGLILSNSLNRNETTIVLINGVDEPSGPRVTAVPDKPLSYQVSPVNAGVGLPPVPFGYNVPRFIDNFITDITLSGREIQQRFNESLQLYAMYTGALVFLLCSLGFIMKMSAWPLANLFLGILAFRGILSLEIFFNSPEIQELINPLLGNIIDAAAVVPAIFTGFALLIYLYSILVYITKRHGSNEYY